ncbi:MAG: hypothetical protein PHQ04_11405 [Opitutaceae bacterium]|nr:hypothetical protein [Opitutaceae bacterium]
MTIASTCLLSPFGQLSPAPRPTAASRSKPTLENALTEYGCRLRPDGEDFLGRVGNLEVRTTTIADDAAQHIRLEIIAAERRLRQSAISVFDALAQEGHPIAGFGSGRGVVAFEFCWRHDPNRTWRDEAQRCLSLVDRVHTSVLNG